MVTKERSSDSFEEIVSFIAAKLMKGETPSIALDMDDVVANLAEPVVYDINKLKGGDYKIEDWTDWDKSKISIPISQKEHMDIYYRIWEDEPERIKAHVEERLLIEAQKHFEMDIVTGRDEGTLEPVMRWMKMRFPNVDIGIVGTGSVAAKFDMKYSLYVDDGNPLADTILENDTCDKRLILVSQPWNAGKGYEKCPNIIVMDSTEDALRFLVEAMLEARARLDALVLEEGPEQQHVMPRLPDAPV